MYICVYAYMCAYIYIFSHTDIHMYIYIYMHIYMNRLFSIHVTNPVAGGGCTNSSPDKSLHAGVTKTIIIQT